MTETMPQLQSALLAYRTAAGNSSTEFDTSAVYQALAELADAAAHEDQMGLQDCLLLMQQHIDDVTADSELAPAQICLLQDWPAVIQGYLDNGGTPAASERLLDILQASCWPVPLNSTDADILHEMLVTTAADAESTTALSATIERLAAIIRAIDDAPPETLQRAAAELEQVAQDFGEASEMGLQDCALLLQQNIQDIAQSGEPLTDVQTTLLTAWSGLAAKCLKQANDPAPRRAIIQNLCHDHWPAALNQADAAILYDLFGIEPPALESALESATESATETDSESSQSAPDNVTPLPGQPAAASQSEPPALARLDASLSHVELDNPTTLTDLTAPLAELADTAGNMEQLGLQDICLLLQQQLEDLIEVDSGLSIAQLEKIKQWRQDISDYLAKPGNSAAADSLLNCLADDCWPNPLNTGDIEIIREMLTSDSASTSETTPTAATTLATAPATQPVSEAQTNETSVDSAANSEFESIGSTDIPDAVSQPISLKLIDMLASESVQIHEDARQLYDQLYAADLTAALRSNSLSQYGMRMERFANASQAAELIGLQHACEIFHKNINNLERHGESISEHQIAMLRDWPQLVSDYLGNIGDATVSQALVDNLADSAWPKPLDGERQQPLIDLLTAAYISEQSLTSERMQTATAEEISLEIPADINEALLEGMLQELPSQTESFSEHIQALASGNGSKTDLERGQRVAHTIKGAANTVGVRGLANLTHQIEDLLVILVEHERMPSQSLASTLVDAADCLEEMSEALIERGSTLPGAQQTLQAVLDWINQIERDGVESMDSAAPVTTGQPATEPAADKPADKPSDKPSSETEEEQAQSAMLRVPATLIDDLLRMVGETMIVTAQLQEKVRQCSDQNETLLKEHDLFQELVGELEQQVDVGGIASKLASAKANNAGFDTLELEQYNELHTVTHRLVEAAADSRELDQDIGQYLRSLDELLINQSRLQREVQDLVMRTRMVPLKTIVPRLQRAVRQTCRLTSKQADLILEGTDIQLDSDILNSLVDPLMHMLRNAVDHGIESREQRINNGKEPTGSIKLSCISEGTQIVLYCEDDGAGLDLGGIRSLAEKRGLISSDDSLSDQAIRRLILTPGFSTRSETTQTSGRGIGMDVVASQLQAIKGSLMIDSAEGQGTRFELRLPVSLMTTHGLLVRIRKQVMAISTRGIVQILHPDDGSIQGSEAFPCYQLEDEQIDLHQIDDLLQLPPDRRKTDRDTRPALLIREEALNCAVQVENVIDSRDLVVKPLGPYLNKIRGMVGATILGDGSVVPVLDLPELIRTPHDAVAGQAELTDTRISRSLPVALVVDDSISARRTLAQIVRDAGYDVRTAKDGLEAITLIEKRQPDIILTDLEMPRMNGIELATHIKTNADTSALPVVIITSRATDKHRQLAESAGVDVYLTKPYSEDELLQHVYDLLEGSYSTSA